MFNISSLWDHSWFVFDTPMDKLRSFLWVTANGTTALAYFMLPIEYWFWQRAFPFKLTAIVIWCLIGFTVFCGAHHVVDILLMPTAPWWALLWVNIPMAISSIGTALFFRHNRDTIVRALDVFSDALEKLDVIKKKGHSNGLVE